MPRGEERVVLPLPVGPQAAEKGCGGVEVEVGVEVKVMVGVGLIVRVGVQVFPG
jgi:hypothetical protein